MGSNNHLGNYIKDPINENHFVIALDLDGVVFDYTAAFRKVLSIEKNIPLEEIPEDTVAWGYDDWPYVAGDPARFTEIHEAGVLRHNMFRNMETLPGVSKNLWKLEDLHGDVLQIDILTHRLGLLELPDGHAKMIADTVESLQRPSEGIGSRPRIPFHSFHCVGGVSSVSKSRVSADVYIDDSPSNIDGFVANGYDVIAIDHKYNRHCNPTDRAYTWDMAFDMLNTRINAWREARSL